MQVKPWKLIQIFTRWYIRATTLLSNGHYYIQGSGRYSIWVGESKKKLPRERYNSMGNHHPKTVCFLHETYPNITKIRYTDIHSFRSKWASILTEYQDSAFQYSWNQSWSLPIHRFLQKRHLIGQNTQKTLQRGPPKRSDNHVRTDTSHHEETLKYIWKIMKN